MVGNECLCNGRHTKKVRVKFVLTNEKTKKHYKTKDETRKNCAGNETKMSEEHKGPDDPLAVD